MSSSYMERKEIVLGLAVVVGAAFVLVFAALPTGWTVPELKGMTSLEAELLGLLVVVSGGAVLAFTWHLIHVAGQAVIIFALVVFGAVLAFPAFIALGLVGCLFTALGLHKMARRSHR